MKKYLEKYINNKPLFFSFIRPMELRLMSEHQPFEKPILDFGCGDGFFTKLLFGDKRIEAGVDIDDSVLSAAKKSKVYKKVFIIENGKLPFADNTFSTVISNCVLEHIDNLPSTIKEIRRVLRKKGILYVTVMTDKWNDYLIGAKLFGEVYSEWMKKIQKHSSLLSEKGWEELFKKSGFIVMNKSKYVDKKTAHLLELFHYLSVDSLITYKLFRKWVLFPKRYNLWGRFFKERINALDFSEGSAAVFFAIRKV